MRRMADTGDISLVLNVDEFAHADTLDRNKLIPREAVKDIQKIIDSNLRKVQEDVIKMVGDKLSKDSNFKKILEKHNLVSKYADKYSKVANKIAAEIIGE